MWASRSALYRTADELDVFGARRASKARERRVAVVDQETDLTVAVVNLHQQVACLLQHPER
jgi:hypothetical protein